MPLLRLDLHHLRNLDRLSLEFDPRLNLIVGPNASGKTSLLEAIHLLGHARSFRTSRSRELIRHGEDSLIVAGRVLEDGRKRHIGVGFQGRRREIRIDGRVLDSRAELLRILPVRILAPSLHGLLEDSPRVRRRFLDWGVFYFDTTYLAGWRNYRRALEQRNASLRAGDSRGACLWGREVAKYGKMISCCRRRYLQALQEDFLEVARQTALEGDLELRYLRGWADDRDLESVLAGDLEKDLRYGCTHSGPHRDDFMVYAAGRPVRQCFSRGQMKLLVYALAMIQGRLLPYPGCLLIDDLASELDLENQALLATWLVQSKEQVFITATQPEVFSGLPFHDGRMFHVKHNCLVPA